MYVSFKQSFMTLRRGVPLFTRTVWFETESNEDGEHLPHSSSILGSHRVGDVEYN